MLYFSPRSCRVPKEATSPERSTVRKPRDVRTEKTATPSTHVDPALVRIRNRQAAMISEQIHFLFFYIRYAEVGDKHVNYRFSCGSKGEVVPLTAMCNGSVECTNGKDETHAFCPYNSERERRTAGGGSCKPKCKNGGKCRSRSNKCICSDFWTGDRCETRKYRNRACYPVKFITYKLFHYQCVHCTHITY